MTVKHVIFDCDGVLVDSEPLSMRADVALLRRHGIDMSEQEAHSLFVGKTFQAMLDMMTERYGTVFPAGLHEVKNRMLEEFYHTDLRIVPGVADVLQLLKDRGLSFSIASNSPRKRVELAVKLTGIAHHFDAITTYEDVARGKPAPDVFQLAARRAGHAAAQCLVVEDSATGVTAGVAAGIATIGFVGTHHEPEHQSAALRAAGAAHIIGSITELPSLVARL